MKRAITWTFASSLLVVSTAALAQTASPLTPGGCLPGMIGCATTPGTSQPAIGGTQAPPIGGSFDPTNPGGLSSSVGGVSTGLAPGSLGSNATVGGAGATGSSPVTPILPTTPGASTPSSPSVNPNSIPGQQTNPAPVTSLPGMAPLGQPRTGVSTPGLEPFPGAAGSLTPGTSTLPGATTPILPPAFPTQTP